MNQERRFPKIEKEKGIKKTGEIPTDETLFEGFYSLERPTLRGVEKLEKELSEYPEIKPRLTFLFPLDKKRIGAIEMIRTGKINEDQVIKLIESQDFVKRDTGDFFLGKTKGLSKESIIRLQSILENKEWKEKNKELAEKIKVKIILETQKENAFGTLMEMTEDKNWKSRMAAVEGLGELGNEKALPCLEEVCEKGFPVLIKKAAQARVNIILKNQREKALPILIKMYLEPGQWQIRLAAAEGLGNLANKGAVETLERGKVENLKSLEKDAFREEIKQAIRNSINHIVEKGSEESRVALKELSRDKNKYVSRPAAQSLARFIIKTEGKKADEVLKETFKDYDERIKEAVEFEKNKHEWLLGAQKSLFATSHTNDLIENLTGLAKISQQLKEKYGDKFIGINVFGSASKGYFKKGRDIDFGIIAQKDVMGNVCKYDYIIKKPKMTLYYELHKQIIIDENDEIINDEFPNLFRGIFFGVFSDYQRLIHIQKKFLEKNNENKWDRVREMYTQREINNFHKLAERFGIAGEEKIKDYPKKMKNYRLKAIRGRTSDNLKNL